MVGNTKQMKEFQYLDIKISSDRDIYEVQTIKEVQISGYLRNILRKNKYMTVYCKIKT